MLEAQRSCLSSDSQFSRSVVSDTLWPHGLQHARPACPSPTPGAYSNLRPLSLWCHPTISSFGVPLSSWLQSFSASGSFLVSQFFTSGGQRTGSSASASVLPVNTQDWSHIGWIGWISLEVQGTLKSLLQHHSFKSINSLVLSFHYSPTDISTHDYWKCHSFD